MKLFNRKNMSVALLVTMGAFFSVNASAAQTSTIENSVSEFVLEQGHQMMVELSSQLQQSITAEISELVVDFSLDESINDSITWFTGEGVSQSIVTETVQNNESNQEIICKNEINKKSVTE
ncbi:MAG: hypothetical protein OCD00_07615 [Colwellia sp.]